MNRVCEILNIKKPIVLGPMSWITSPELVAAISNAGGLGVLGISAGSEEIETTIEGTAEAMRRAIRKTRELTDQPFGVDVFPKSNDVQGFSAAIVEVMKEENVKIAVLAGVGITEDDVKNLKNDGFTVIFREINPSVRSAVMAEKAGADIIVATGCDEGGCMPVASTGTLSITALIADAVSIPVLAAGGIVNEKMAKATAVVGAEGGFVGTRFILSKECRAAQVIKDDIMATHPDDYIEFVQMNGFSKWRSTPHKIALEGRKANQNGDLNPNSGSFFAGMYKGDLDASVNTVSNVASLIKSIDSCEDIVNELAKGYE